MNDVAHSQVPAPSTSNSPPLAPELLLRIHEEMVKARCLEERLVQMYRQGHGYFWIGGPGEEAFNVPLGLLMKRGQGPAFDYLHAHYRQSATILALGEDPTHALRQMKNTATDPYSAGRNFAGHFSIRRWNIVPVSSPIEVQYSMAPGTALAQRRHGGDGITIVTGGDAGTAEGDFASCLIWSSRPGNELPILIIVTNNRWGISTSYDTQQGAKQLSDRGIAFGMKTKTIDGNDPVNAYFELQAAMNYIRKERKPFLMEVNVSRLFGHSSASGANMVTSEMDCIPTFEAKLAKWGVADTAHFESRRKHWTDFLADAARKVRDEPQPEGSDIWKHIFKEGA